MAFLDTENNGLYSAGDPLEELDRELAELKKTLGDLDGGMPSDDPAEMAVSADAPIEEADTAPSGRDEPETEDEPSPDPDEDDEARTETAGETAPPHHTDRTPTAPPSGKKRIIAVIVILILITAAVAGFTWIKNKTTSEKDEKVVFHDPELGDIELDDATGAALNTLDNDGFTTDENGFPAYYEGEEKISHLGVDLSENQGTVDFEALKNAGVEFVMLRVGGRFYGSGEFYSDQNFNTYYEKAKAAGLKIGAYFFSQAISVDEAKEEADYMLKQLSGKQLDYPVAFDWEHIEGEEARSDVVSASTLTNCAQTFCDAVADAGYKPIVYSNTHQMLRMYDFSVMKDYDFWLADYRDTPNMYYKFVMWQCTTEGQVDGIEGNVDLNLSFTDFS